MSSEKMEEEFGEYTQASMRVCGKRIKELDLVEEVGSLSWEEKVERDSLRKEFLLLAIKEETFWRQRSRIQ